MKTSRTSHHGFTLVEIIVVVAVIGLLAAITIPKFAKARDRHHRNECAKNLGDMELAVTEFANFSRVVMKSPLTNSALTTADVEKLMRDTVGCPSGGSYSFTRQTNRWVGVCAFPGHTNAAKATRYPATFIEAELTASPITNR